MYIIEFCFFLCCTITQEVSFFLFFSPCVFFVNLSVMDRYGTRSVSLTANQSGPLQISITQRCQKYKKNGREGSLSLVSSQASRRGIRNGSIDIPMVFVAAVRQPVSASHSNLFTSVEH